VIAITLTTGQSAATERQVLDRVGSRAVRIERVQGGPDLPSASVAAIARLDRVEWAIGLSAPVDGRNAALAPGGDAVAFRTLVGELPRGVRLPQRTPMPSEALVPSAAADTLGLVDHVGVVELADRQSLPVVGTFEASGPVAFVGQTGIVIAPQTDVGLQRIELFVTETAALDTVIAASLAIVDAEPGDVAVVRASALADLDTLLRSDLRQSGRRLLAGVLATGALLIAATTAAQTLLRRKDFGRRRALGSTRSTVVVLVVLQTVLPAAVGAIIGAIISAALAATGRIANPPPGFTPGVVVLALLTTIAASLVPAVVTGRRDPLAVLRTP
jgi:putative ABC transport system permease protein